MFFRKCKISKLNPIKNLRSGDGWGTAFIDPAGETADANGIDYRLNPVKNVKDGCSYVDSFLDPAGTTVQANGGKYYLNPIKSGVDGNIEGFVRL